MALNKTTADLKVIETTLPEKVASQAGQLIFSDDGKLFYDNTVNGRTRINPEGLKFVDTSSLGDDDVIAPYTSLRCDTADKTVTLETVCNNEGWLSSYTPEFIAPIRSKYYGLIPKTGKIQDKFWEMLEGDNVFIDHCLEVEQNSSSSYYEGFPIQFICRGDGVTSDATIFTGTVIRTRRDFDFPVPHFNLSLRVDGFDDSRSAVESLFNNYGNLFTTVRVQVKLRDTKGAYVTWTGSDLQLIHGYQESSNSPITFNAPLQIRNPETGEMESIQTQQGGYIKFLGLHTVDEAINIFDEGTEGVIQSTEAIDYGPVYTSLALEPTWVMDRIMGTRLFVEIALPFPRKFLSNVSTIYLSSIGTPDSERAYGHIVNFLEDCGSFCIVEVEWDYEGEFQHSMSWGINEFLEVEYTISVKRRELLWHHTNEFGVQFIEVFTQPVILDEVDENDDRPVRSSGIAKYFNQYVAKSDIANEVTSTGVMPVSGKAVNDAIRNAIQFEISAAYKPKGSCTVDYINTRSTTDTIYDSIGNVINIATSGTILQPNLTSFWSRSGTIQSISANSDGSYQVEVSIPGSQSYTLGDYGLIEKFYLDSTSYSSSQASFSSDTQLVFKSVTADEVSTHNMEVGSVLHVSFGYGDIEVLIGDNVVWTELGWDKLAATVDLTGYQPKLEFASEINSQNSGKAVTVGPVKSYVDSEISKFLESSGSILNLVGSGQATEVGSYTFAEATTVGANAVACTITFETPSYKLMIPAIQAPVGTMLSINGEINVYIMDSYGHVTPDTVFTFEVLPDGSLTQMAISATESTNMPHIIGKLSEARINSVSIKSDRAITFDANTVVKIYGWPMVQESSTATSINAMLKEIYDTQEAFKAQTSIPDSDNAVKSYTSVADLPTVANSGSVAAVTSDGDKSARGLYMFISGKWQRFAFAGESLVDGDTVDVTIE